MILIILDTFVLKTFSISWSVLLVNLLKTAVAALLIIISIFFSFLIILSKI